MSKKEIIVLIDKDGKPQIEAVGYTDGSCRSATEAIEKALGGVTERKMKRGGGDCEPKAREKVTG